MHHFEQVHLRGMGVGAKGVRRTSTANEPGTEPVKRRLHADMVPRHRKRRPLLRLRAPTGDDERRKLHAPRNRQRHVIVDTVLRRNPRPLLQGARQAVHYIRQVHLRGVVILVVYGVCRASSSDGLEPDPVR